MLPHEYCYYYKVMKTLASYKQGKLASSEKASYEESRTYFTFITNELHLIFFELASHDRTQDYTILQHVIPKNYGKKRHFPLTCKTFKSSSFLNALKSF